MESAAAAAARRSSATSLDLRSDVLSILRRSLAIFFSTSVVGPLLLVVASLLLFLFRSLLLYLTFRCTATRMKLRDDPNHSIAIMIYYEFVAIILNLAFAFVGYFILYSALHLTALLTVLSSLVKKPPPTAGSFIETIRHGCRFSNGRLLVFPKTALLSKLIQQTCAVVLLISLTGGDGPLRSLRKMALGPTPFHLLDDVEGRFPVLIGAWTAVEVAASVVVNNLAPWVLLFLDPAADHERRNIRVWYVLKRGCFLMSLMLFQAMTVKILEDVVCGDLRRKDLMTIMAAGDWMGLFLVLVVKSVAEAFFTVVWLVFYVAARCMAAAKIGGEAFGMQDLSNCLARLR